MSLSSFNQVVATTDNQGFLARDIKVYEGNGQYAVNVGQPVAWNPRTGLSVDETDIPNLEKVKISIGAGKGKGKATRIVTLGGNEYNLCKDKVSINFTKACCGRGQVVDSVIGCVEPDTNYQLDIHLKTPYTKMLFGGDGPAPGEVVFSYDYTSTVEGNCGTGDCNPTTTPFEVACGLAEKINRYSGTVEIPGIGDRFDMTFDNKNGYYQPFYAVAIESTKSIYHVCLDLQTTDGACETCTHFDGMSTITVVVTGPGGVGTEEIVLDFSNYSQNNGEETTPEQLYRAQEYANGLLHPKGAHMHISQQVGACCPFTITIAGCVESTPVIVMDDGIITAAPTFSVEDPFNDKERAKLCTACGGDTETLTPGAKIRYFFDSIQLPSKCNLPADALEYDNLSQRIVDIQFTGDTWANKYVWWEEIQSEIEPEGYGRGYMLEYFTMSHRGGEGGFYEYGGERYGRFSNVTLTDYQDDDEFNNIKHDENYCAMNWTFVTSDMFGEINAPTRSQLSYSKVLIPKSDQITHDAFVTILTPVVAINKCEIIGEGCFAANGPCSPCTTCAESVAAIVANEGITQFSLNSTVQAANDVVVAAEAALADAESSLATFKTVAADDSLSTAERDQAIGNVALAQGRVDQAQAELDEAKAALEIAKQEALA